MCFFAKRVTPTSQSLAKSPTLSQHAQSSIPQSAEVRTRASMAICLQGSPKVNCHTLQIFLFWRNFNQQQVVTACRVRLDCQTLQLVLFCGFHFPFRPTSCHSLGSYGSVTNSAAQAAARRSLQELRCAVMVWRQHARFRRWLGGLAALWICRPGNLLETSIRR